VAAGSQDGQQQEQQGWLHPNFRLWLTSLPAAYFPAQVLQSGIKITLEAPRGVRANMLRCYGTLSDSSLAACDACGCGPHYRRLVFLLSLTHALLLERGRFGPMGWSKPYEFSDGDFSCSLQVLQGLLQHAAADRDQNMTAAAAAAIASSLAGLPLAAVEHMWGHIVYGGRVTDASDMRLLQVMLQQQLRTELLAGTGSLTGSGESWGNVVRAC
jgi:dynein heavy chain